MSRFRVDNETAVKNLTRLGKKTGLAVACDVIEGGWLMTFSEGDGDEPAQPDLDAALAAGSACSVGGGCGYAVFIGKRISSAMVTASLAATS